MGVACALTWALVSPAAAESAGEAFARGREALRVGDYLEACDAFEDSQRAAPTPETQFNIALCSEQLGKLATALSLHRAVAASDSPRRAKAAELAAALEPRVPRLRIRVKPADVEDLTLTVGGEPVESLRDVPINVGTTRLSATAPGYREWTGDVSVAREGKTARIVIRLVKEDGTSEPDGPEDVEPEEDDPDPSGGGIGGAGDDRRSSRRTLAGVTIVVGGAALLGAGALGILARAKWDDAQTMCPGKVCPTDEVFATATDLQQAARLRGNVSTVFAITGGVALATGIVLWVRSPATRQSLAVAPSVGRDTFSLTVVGRF